MRETRSVLWCFVALLPIAIAPGLCWADAFPGPSDSKAQKTFTEADQKLKEHKRLDALDAFKKADKQDGHHCGTCAEQVIALSLETGDYKLAVEYANELVSIAQSPAQSGTAHALRGIAQVRQALADHKKNQFADAEQDLQLALADRPNDMTVLYFDGIALANLMQDDAARQRFTAYAKLQKPGSMMQQRALRYASEPELGRARMAPPFEFTTIDGRHYSLDDLQGKVVLIDFWATWCGPCREALPSIQHLAQKFSEQPLVVLSISLDRDEGKWKSFVAEHKMTWMQARDDSSNGSIATRFGVHEIPHTFSIDADGVLQDEHVGDSAMEGKLKKLIAQAQQMHPAGVVSEEAKLSGK